MIKNVILCETINGGIRGLLTMDDLSKVNFDKVVGFTRENQECRDDNGMPMREQYAIGVPYVCNLEELERVYKDFINRHISLMMNIIIIAIVIVLVIQTMKW